MIYTKTFDPSLKNFCMVKIFSIVVYGEHYGPCLFKSSQISSSQKANFIQKSFQNNTGLLPVLLGISNSVPNRLKFDQTYNH